MDEFPKQDKESSYGSVPTQYRQFKGFSQSINMIWLESSQASNRSPHRHHPYIIHEISADLRAVAIEISQRRAFQTVLRPIYNPPSIRGLHRVLERKPRSSFHQYTNPLHRLLHNHPQTFASTLPTPTTPAITTATLKRAIAADGALMLGTEPFCLTDPR